LYRRVVPTGRLFVPWAFVHSRFEEATAQTVRRKPFRLDIAAVIF
jgi:hypothetical protein